MALGVSALVSCLLGASNELGVRSAWNGFAELLGSQQGPGSDPAALGYQGWTRELRDGLEKQP